MRVFISWSGDLSRQLADAIHRWLPSVLQFVKPYLTPSDVEKGTRWPNEISKELTQSTFGIITLTRDNLRSPWISFEAGAISKTVEQGRVCPIVFGIEPTDVEWPLAQFQASRFTKQEIQHLVRTINAAAGDNKLSESGADSAFGKWWPDLETEVNRILTSAASAHPAEQVRSERELMEEMLSLVRNIASRQEQLEAANQNRDLVAALLRPQASTMGSITPPSGSLGTSMGSPAVLLEAFRASERSKTDPLDVKVTDYQSKKRDKE